MNRIFRRKEKRCVLIFVLKIKISNQKFVSQMNNL